MPKRLWVGYMKRKDTIQWLSCWSAKRYGKKTHMQWRLSHRFTTRDTA